MLMKLAHLIALATLLPSLSLAQSEAPRPRGWETSALPALNFNADEGFGYGIIAQAYNYGDGTATPYRYTIQPLLFLTTKGRRDLSVFFDAPHLLPGGWRLGAYAAREQQLATPYYGVGNATTHDENSEKAPNPYFYRYGRTALRLNADLQRTVTGPLRMLVGAGYRSLKIDETPFDSGTTLLSQQGTPVSAGASMSARTGLVFDTRDRETGPTRGQWIEALFQYSGFTRVTATPRTYLPLGGRITWAQRVVAQNVSGDVEFYDLFPIQGSFRDGEGLGGSGTVRGLPTNRYMGKGLAFANEELRWRAS